MTEQELDRLRRELPPLVGRIVRSSSSLLKALEDPARLKAIGRPAEAMTLREALVNFESWLTRAGGLDLLAEAMVAVIRNDDGGGT